MSHVLVVWLTFVYFTITAYIECLKSISASSTTTAAYPNATSEHNITTTTAFTAATPVDAVATNKDAIATTEDSVTTAVAAFGTIDAVSTTAAASNILSTDDIGWCNCTNNLTDVNVTPVLTTVTSNTDIAANMTNKLLATPCNYNNSISKLFTTDSTSTCQESGNTIVTVLGVLLVAAILLNIVQGKACIKNLKL